MRVDDLDFGVLFSPARGGQGGVLQFAGQRTLLLDAAALGLLRSELISLFGLTAARGVLTRFGYAHGWRTAESLKSEFPWDTERDWQTAGGKLHTIQGFARVESTETEGGPLAEADWHDSYEAEQHLVHVGQADEAVCWTLCGFASGYLSCCNRREVYCIEDRCRGKGDAVCHMVGRAREEWGAAIEPHLPFYRKDFLDESLRSVTEALKRCERRLATRRRELARSIEPSDADASGMVARSEAMRSVIDLAKRVAKVDATALVTGETGVGKERIARLIHAESARAGGPFVAVNCGAVSPTLLESELFGHTRGAFTGATQDRAGLFEAASRGTLFLDEVGEVPPEMQVKLLRVLQEREVRRVGENRSRPVDVRLVAATHRDLAAEAASGRFRQDLYYRLRVIDVFVPPLRERPDDILPLARVVLADVAKRIGRKISGFEPAAADRLLHCRWPGNVRELANAIERAAVVANGERIRLEDLPPDVRSTPPSVAAAPGTRSLADVEREYILATLRANGGNQRRTARQLGIGTATLYRKLKRYDVQGT